LNLFPVKEILSGTFTRGGFRLIVSHRTPGNLF